jgi:hypothetical protein
MNSVGVISSNLFQNENACFILMLRPPLRIGATVFLIYGAIELLKCVSSKPMLAAFSDGISR